MFFQKLTGSRSIVIKDGTRRAQYSQQEVLEKSFRNTASKSKASGEQSCENNVPCIEESSIFAKQFF